MSKYTIEDINILGEGLQIKKYILSRYESIEVFYRNNSIPVSLKSLKTYLSQERIKSATFKCAVMRALNTDYHEVVLNDKEQVKVFTWNINKNIRSYNSDDDGEILELVYNLCAKHELTIERAMMYRAKAVNYFFRNYINDAFKQYEKAIETIGKIDISKLVFFYCEVADTYFRENNLFKAEHYYSIAEDYLKHYKICDEVLYRYHYWRGIMHNNVGTNKYARELFIKALNLADNDQEKAQVLINIGLSYKREKLYENAIYYYNEALEWMKSNDNKGRSAVFNNIAEVCKISGKHPEALDYIKKALDAIKNEDLYHGHIVCSQTYAEIGLLRENLSSCDLYFGILLKTIHKQVEKKYIINSIKSIVSLTSNLLILNKLEGIILNLKNNTDNEDYRFHLYGCLGLLYEKKMSISMST